MYNFSNQRNIVLIGYMGSGKSSVGKCLASKLNYEFFDTDTYIEHNLNISISEIFRVYGENYFRILEKTLAEQLIKKKLQIM
jgi:shikimate kinase